MEEYKLVSGNHADFEKKLNQLSKEGWMPLGNMVMSDDGQTAFYAQLMQLM